MLSNGSLNCGTPSSGGGGGSQWNISTSSWLINDSNILDWNESKGNDTYVNVDGDTMTDDLNMSDNNLTDVVRLVYNTSGCTEDSVEGTTCWNEDQQTLNIVTGLDITSSFYQI